MNLNFSGHGGEVNRSYPNTGLMCTIGLGRFTVTSHAETRARLLRLVGKTVKMAAIFVVFTF